MAYRVKMKVRKLIDSFRFAIDGIVYVITTQRNMRIHLGAAITALLLGLWFDLSRSELLLLLFAIVLVLVTEMLNTALEQTVDMITQEYHPLAKIAKNVAAGAVLVTAVHAAIVGFILFYDKANPFATLLMWEVRRSPFKITIIALLVMLLLILALKSYGERYKNGWAPSGLSALAFSVCTAISLLTANVFITCLALFVAILVVFSRLETGYHSLMQVLTGAMFGILVTVGLFQLFS